MPLTDENRGTNANGSSSEDYCVYCYKKGEFTQDFTMSQMIEFCLQFLDQWAVQMSKIHAKSFNEVWMATSVGSMKVNDFKANNKAGLCYDHYGDGVALRGTVEIITDDTIRKDIWQDWFVHHFPDGPSDPNYVLLHFMGTEATFWINGEFSHSNI